MVGPRASDARLSLCRIGNVKSNILHCNALSNDDLSSWAMHRTSDRSSRQAIKPQAPTHNPTQWKALAARRMLMLAVQGRSRSPSQETRTKTLEVVTM
jgi:hypothetical protein